MRSVMVIVLENGHDSPSLLTANGFEKGIKEFLCNIMAEEFRFMPLGLVGLRTFQLSAWVT